MSALKTGGIFGVEQLWGTWSSLHLLWKKCKRWDWGLLIVCHLCILHQTCRVNPLNVLTVLSWHLWLNAARVHVHWTCWNEVTVFTFTAHRVRTLCQLFPLGHVHLTPKAATVKLKMALCLSQFTLWSFLSSATAWFALWILVVKMLWLWPFYPGYTGMNARILTAWPTSAVKMRQMVESYMQHM